MRGFEAPSRRRSWSALRRGAMVGAWLASACVGTRAGQTLPTGSSSGARLADAGLASGPVALADSGASPIATAGAELLATFHWFGATETYHLGVSGNQVLLATSYSVFALDLVTRNIVERARLPGYFPAWAASGNANGLYWSAGYASSDGAAGGRMFSFDVSSGHLDELGGPRKHPCSFRVDGDEVTWIELGTNDIVRARRGGGVRKVGHVPADWVLENDCSPNLPADQQFLYFGVQNAKPGIQDDAIVALPIAGGTARLLALGVTSPRHVAIDDDYVYFSTSLPSALSRVPKANGKVAELVTDTDVTSDIIVRGDRLYWVQGGFQAPYSIRRSRKDGSGVEVVYQGDARSVRALTFAGEYVYWVAHGNPPGECRDVFEGCGQNPMKRWQCDSPQVHVFRLRVGA